jgi:anti-sigma B factor antagonist
MEVRVVEDVQVLALSGSFNNYTAPPARQWLDEVASQPPAYVVVNLSGVSFIDSTALSTLVGSMKRSRELHGDVRLCGLQQPVRMIFEMTRLDRVFEIYNHESDAIQAFSQAGQGAVWPAPNP